MSPLFFYIQYSVYQLFPDSSRRNLWSVWAFISIIIREKFDYTKWQRDYFDAKTPAAISAEASQFEMSHPFTGDAVRL